MATTANSASDPSGRQTAERNDIPMEESIVDQQTDGTPAANGGVARLPEGSEAETPNINDAIDLSQ